MALTKVSLSAKIEAEIIALYGTPDDSAQLKNFADALAKAIVDEIQANAQVIIPGGSSAGTYGVT